MPHSGAVLRFKLSIVFAALLCATSLSNLGIAQEQPLRIPGFNVVALASGFDRPTAFVFLPEGRILVAEQDGLIRMLHNGVLKQTPVLDLRERVNSRAERGLLAIAADPQFKDNGFIYALFTRDGAGQTPDAWDERRGVLARYSMAGDRANAQSEKILFDDYESFTAYHSLGALRFARNGDLFVSLGDASTPGDISERNLRPQNLDVLQGKMLRLSRSDGAGLPGNPFFDAANPKSTRSRIWAYGLRNAFRFDLNPVDGLPYAGDVGWFTYESVLRVAAGSNFGWPCMEGGQPRTEYAQYSVCAKLDQKTLVKPASTYQRQGDKNAAVIGGAFNTGRNFPLAMQGEYFYSDYGQGFLRRVAFDGRGGARESIFATNVQTPVDIQFGPDGALYLLSHGQAQLYRISHARTNLLPEPRMSATLRTATGSATQSIASDVFAIHAYAPVTLTFDAAQSFDLDNEKLTYAWSLDPERAPSNGVTATHSYTRPGRYLAQLSALDPKGFYSTARKVVLIAAQPLPGAIVSPGSGDVLQPGVVISLTQMGWPITQTGVTSRWSAVIVNGAISRTLAITQTPTPMFAMPVLTDSERIEVSLESRDASGAVLKRDAITLYAMSEDGYIRSWQLIAGKPERYLDFDALPLGEANFVLPDPGIEAIQLRSKSRKIDLAASLRPIDHTAGYAFAWIDSPEDRTALLGLLSDDGIAVWLNGEPIWRHSVSRFVADDTRDIDLPQIRLKKGRNALLIKVDQNVGEWAFKARVLNADGSIMRDIAVRTSP